MKVPRDRIWTAKDDARYISPLVGTPGYRHTIGLARVWHFIDVHGFIATGIVFIVMLFDTEQWRRIVPTSPLVAFASMEHLGALRDFSFAAGAKRVLWLQRIATDRLFHGVFVFGPLAIATGIAMSPAVVNRFPWYARIFGGRQSARSIHFLTMFSFLAFLVVHVTLIVMTGFARNMNHIVMGTDDQKPIGMYLGFVGIGVVVLSWIVAHYISWHHPRGVQHALKSVTYPMQLLTLNRLLPQQKYTENEISPYFWPNGKMPIRDDWKHLAESGFDGFRLKVGGLVKNPVELSLADLERLGEVEHITMHHCIQGWSGIAKWGGIPMQKLIELVQPKPEAKVVAFFSFGEALYGGPYYDTQSLENVQKPQCLLASRMNGQRASAGVRSTSAAASGKPAWLQDGQMDRADRIHRIGKIAWQRRRRQKRRR